MRPTSKRGFRHSCWQSGFLLAALTASAPTFAAGHLRLANALLLTQGAIAEVEVRIDDRVLSSGLRYRSHTGYFESASLTPMLSVWHGGVRIFERRLELRDRHSHLLVLHGNESALAPITVSSIDEGSPVLAADHTQDYLMLVAPYSGFPGMHNLESVRSVQVERRCRAADGRGGSGRGGQLRMQPGLPLAAGDAQVPDAEGSKAFEDLQPGWCRSTMLTSEPTPRTFSVNYENRGGHYAHSILIGDDVRAPVELWHFDQPALEIDPVAVAPGPWVAGIWIAPEWPGLSLNLQVDPAADGGRGRISGILTGNDAEGRPRWNLLRGWLSMASVEQRFRATEIMGSSAGTLNEVNVPIPMISASFHGCHAMHLRLSIIGGQSPRRSAIALLHEARGSVVRLQRATPSSLPCPN